MTPPLVGPLTEGLPALAATLAATAVPMRAPKKICCMTSTRLEPLWLEYVEYEMETERQSTHVGAQHSWATRG
eukprot:8311634-Pyramimonas_sp.AAC.1